MMLVDDHLNHCVRQAAAEGGEVADEKLSEVEKVSFPTGSLISAALARPRDDV